MTTGTGPKRQQRARRRNGGAEEGRERALLAEFLRHRDVASLAGAIARRLGGGVRETDLIAGAGLEPRREDSALTGRQRFGATLARTRASSA